MVTKYDICPYCNEKMEAGLIESEGIVSGMKWVQKKRILGIGGEKIGKSNISGLTYLEGFRCKNCRMMILKY